MMTNGCSEGLRNVKFSWSLFDNCELVKNGNEVIKYEIDSQVLNQLSFWDRLIISKALSSKCDYLSTEDLQKTRVFRD